MLPIGLESLNRLKNRADDVALQVLKANSCGYAWNGIIEAQEKELTTLTEECRHLDDTVLHLKQMEMTLDSGISDNRNSREPLKVALKQKEDEVETLGKTLEAETEQQAKELQMFQSMHQQQDWSKVSNYDELKATQNRLKAIEAQIQAFEDHKVERQRTGAEKASRREVQKAKKERFEELQRQIAQFKTEEQALLDQEHELEAQQQHEEHNDSGLVTLDEITLPQEEEQSIVEEEMEEPTAATLKVSKARKFNFQPTKPPLKQKGPSAQSTPVASIALKGLVNTGAVNKFVLASSDHPTVTPIPNRTLLPIKPRELLTPTKKFTPLAATTTSLKGTPPKKTTTLEKSTTKKISLLALTPTKPTLNLRKSHTFKEPMKKRSPRSLLVESTLGRIDEASPSTTKLHTILEKSDEGTNKPEYSFKRKTVEGSHSGDTTKRPALGGDFGRFQGSGDNNLVSGGSFFLSTGDDQQQSNNDDFSFSFSNSLSQAASKGGFGFNF